MSFAHDVHKELKACADLNMAGAQAALKKFDAAKINEQYKENYWSDAQSCVTCLMLFESTKE